MRAPKPTTKRARAADGGDPLVTVRLPASLFVSIKAWAKRGGMSRSAAVRSLLELGMQAAKTEASTGTQPKTRRSFTGQFGKNHLGSAKGVTPLMVAAAHDNASETLYEGAREIPRASKSFWYLSAAVAISSSATAASLPNAAHAAEERSTKI